MQRTNWTEAQRAEAMRIYREQGAAEASKQTGIPIATISSWARRYGENAVNPERIARVASKSLTWEERRIDIANGLGGVAAAAIEVLLGKLAVPDISVAQSLDILEAAVSKAQLLSGGAQSRNESVLTGKAKLIEEARERAGTLRAVS